MDGKPTTSTVREQKRASRASKVETIKRKEDDAESVSEDESDEHEYRYEHEGEDEREETEVFQKRESKRKSLAAESRLLTGPFKSESKRKLVVAESTLAASFRRESKRGSMAADSRLSTGSLRRESKLASVAAEPRLSTEQLELKLESPVSGSHHSLVPSRVRFLPEAASAFDVDDELNRDPDIDEFGEFEDGSLRREDHTFKKLHGIYTRIIDELGQSEAHSVNLEPVKKIFKNVWKAVERSHANVLKLQKKDHVLSVDLSTMMAKTRTLIKLAEDDPLLSTTLKGTLDTSWGLANIGELEEKTVQERIDEFRDEIADLNRNIDLASKTEGQGTAIELKKLRHNLEQKKSNLSEEAAKLQSNNERLKLRREELASNFDTLKEKLLINERDTQMQNEETEEQTKRRQNLDRAIEKMGQDIIDKIEELNSMDSNVTAAQERLTEAEKAVLAQRLINEEAVREKEVAATRFDKMKEDFAVQTQANEKFALDVQREEEDLNLRENELKDVQHDYALVEKEYNVNARRVELLQANLDRLEKDRDALKADLSDLEKKFEASQLKVDANRREVDALDKERWQINRELQKTNKFINEYINEAKTQQVAVRNLEVELTAFEKEITQQQEEIAQLERERDNYSRAATKLAHQVALRLDDMKKLDIAIFEYQRKLADIETQLKKHEQILDGTEHEKSMLTRTLRETTSDIKVNNRKLTHLGHKITTLKFQLAEKNVIIRDAALNYDRIQKETNFFTNESKRIKRLEYDMERQIDGLEVERSTLGRMVAEIEEEISKQEYYTRSAESRRDVYTRKLAEKDKEVKEIWEKWRTLHSTIRIRAYHFRNVMDEIRKLRYYILLSKKEKLIFKNSSRNAQKLRHEIAVLENLISKEICMCNSLREQMKHPINVHRWRILECAHPKSYELVQKSNLLTKRLIERNSLLTKQAEGLTLKQQIYCQIRVVLKKSPGLEAPENVRYYTHLLTAKRKQLSTLKNELKEVEGQRDFFKYELEGIRKRFLCLKENYFKRMRKTVEAQQSCRHSTKREQTR